MKPLPKALDWILRDRWDLFVMYSEHESVCCLAFLDNEGPGLYGLELM